MSSADARDLWKNLRDTGDTAKKPTAARTSTPVKASRLETAEATYGVSQQDMDDNLGVLLDRSYGASTGTARDFVPGIDGLAGGKKWRPYVEFTAAPGSRTMGQINLFAPLLQARDSLLFTDLRASAWTDNVQEGNFGVGYRQIVPGGFFGTDAIFGIYGFVDARHSAYDNMFYQGTLGAELITEHLEFRANGYLPSGKQYVVGVTGVGVALDGSNIVNVGTDLIERALPGFDVEAGVKIDFSDAAIRLNAGYFRFERGDTLVEGPRFRAEVEIEDPFGFDGAKLTLGGEIRDDKVRGTEASGIVRLRMPIGGVSRSVEAERRLTGLDRLMTRRVYRDDDIVSPVVKGAATVTLAPVTDATSGETLQAFFVANTAQGTADCTSVANACEFVTAQGLAGAGDTFMPVDVAGAIGSVFTLNSDRQQVIGAGDSGSATVILPDSASSVLIVTSLGGRPIVSGINIGHFADTGIAGLTTNSATGITGSGFAGSVTISDVRSIDGGLNFSGSAAAISVSDAVFNNGANPGIVLTGLTGSANFTDVDVISAGGTSLSIDGGSLDVTLDSDSTLTQSGAGSTVEVLNSHSGTLTSDATISASNGSGLQFNNADGSYNFNGPSNLGGGDAGIDILGGSAGTFSFGAGTAILLPTGMAFNVTGSTATVTYNGAITQTNAANAISVTANTGGSVTFGGLVTANTGTATAINLAGNAGAAVAFSGGLDIDTTTGTGFSATGGGSVSVAASAGDESITSAAGQALNLNGVSIGTGGITFDSIVSTGSGSTGIGIDGVSGGAFNVSGATSVSGSTGNAIQLTGNAAALNFNGATTITMTSAAVGVDFSGTTSGAVSFADLDIALQSANATGLDLSGAVLNANVTATDFDLTSTSTAGTTGVNLSGATGTGTVQLGDTDVGGGSASIAGVNVGVQFSATSDATFIFGDGENTTDKLSSISATTAIAGGSTVTLGSYDFDDVNFTGVLDFAAAGNPIVFVAATATGDGSGSSVDNRANVTTADAITTAGTTFVLINDGAAIDDADGFTLVDGQTMASFGNGRSFATSGLVIPANFSGVPGASATVTDPTGNGAAILTRTGGAGETLIVSGTVNLQDFILSNAAAGAGLSATGATSITSTGLTVQNVAGQGIDLNSLTGAASTFSNTVVSTTTGNAIDIVNSTVSFIGGLDIDTTTGTGFSATGGGSVSVAASAGDESITSTAGQALNLNGVSIGAGGVTFDSISSTGSATTGIGIDGVSGGAFNVSGATSVSGSTGNAIQLTGNAAALNFDGATTITMTSAAVGVDFSGTTSGAVSFADLDIALQSANATGLDLSGAVINANVTATDFDLASTSTAGTTGVNLSGATGTGTVQLGDTNLGGGSASIAGVNVGVQFSATSDATFIFGDGEGTTDKLSSISATTAIAGGSTVTLGSYDFDDVNFTGVLDFAPSASPVFVAATATGDGTGRDVDNRATVATADAIVATGITFVLINDGAAIDDVDGFTLTNGQTMASFGNGRTFTSSGLVIPTNFSGVPTGAGVTITDPTGNGAAILTRTGGAGETLIVSGTVNLQDFILSNAAAGSGLSATGATSITSTGLTVQNVAGQGIDLNSLTGAASTFSNTVVSTTTGNAIDIVNSTVSFTGGLDIDTTTGTGFSATGGGTISVAATSGTETITTVTGQILNLSNVSIGAGGVSFDSLTATGTIANTAILLSNVDGTGNTFSGGAVSIAGTSGALSYGIEISGGSDATFTFASATIEDTSSNAIHLDGTNGPVTFDTVDIDGVSGRGINIQDATRNITIGGGTIGATTSVSGFSVRIENQAASSTVSLTNLDISSSNSDNLNIFNAAGTVVVTGGTFTHTNGSDVVDISGGSATITIGANLVNTGVGSAVEIDATSGAISFTGTVTNSGGGYLLDIGNPGAITGGTISFSGDMGDTGSQAIRIQNINAGAALTVSGATTLTTPTGTGISLTNNAGTVTFADVTISNPGGNGIDITGTNGAISFGDVDITGLGGNVGLDLNGATLAGALNFNSLDVTGTGAAGSIGIDLRGLTGGQIVNIGAQANPAVGPSSTISVVGTGVFFDAASNANFTFGDGEATDDKLSSISATAAIDGGSAVTLGSYDFDDVNFTGTFDFATSGANLVFVAANATGDGSGSSVSNRATVATADAMGTSGLVFVLINDGNEINDSDGFTLVDGQTMASFGNGRTFTSSGLVIPANFSGIPGGGATVTDPTGNGAAILTRTGGAGDTLIVSGTVNLQDFILSNAAAGAGLSATGATSITSTGLTVQNVAGQGIDLNTLTGAASTFSNTTVSSTTGNAIDIVNSTVSFTGGLDISTTNGIGFNATGGGTISVAASAGIEQIVATGTGTAINLDGITVAAGGINFDQVTTAATATANGVDINDAAGGTITLSNVTLAGTVATAGLDISGNARTSNVVVTGGTIANGVAISGSGSGTVTIGASIAKSAGYAVQIASRDAGAGQVDFNGTVTSSTGAVSIQSNTAGTVNFNAAVTGTGGNTAGAINIGTTTGGTVTFAGLVDLDVTGAGTGVAIANTNAGGTFNFTGGLDITSVNGIALEVLSGTLAISNAGTEAISVTGTAANAVNLNGVTLAAGGVHFDTISSTGALTGEGLRFINVSGGAFTVSDGNAGTSNDVRVADFSNNGGIYIQGSSPDFTFSSVDIDQASGASGHGVSLSDNTGTIQLLGGTIDGAFADGVTISNSANVTLDGISFGGTDALGDDAVAISHSSAVFGSTIVLSNLTVAASTNIGDRGIDVGASGAGQTLNLTLLDNDIHAANEAVFAATSGTGLLVLDLGSAGSNSFERATTGNTVSVTGNALNSANVTGLGGLTVIGNGTGGGVLFDEVTFDADTGTAGIQTVTATGTVQIGQSAGARVNGKGLSFIDPTGDLGLITLTIFNDGGTGLEVNTKGAGTTFNLSNSGGSVDTTNGTALFLDPLTMNLAFSTVTAAGGANGVFIDEGDAAGGAGANALTINTLNVTGTTGAALRINESTGAFTFGTTTIDNTTGGGVDLDLGGGDATVVSFINGLEINTTTGTGFDANGTAGTALTVTITDSGTETITATAGQALTLNGVVIGTAGANFDSLSSTGSGAAGIDLDGLTGGAFTVTGTTTVSGATGAAIQLTGNSASINFSGATSITMANAPVGVDFAGTNGPVSFGATTITGVGDAASQKGIDFNGATLGGAVNFASVAISGPDTATTSIGVDLTGVLGDQVVNLGSGAGATSSITDLHRGVVIDTTAAVQFTFGDGESASDTGSSINVNGQSGAFTVDAGGGTLGASGYDFDDVSFGAGDEANFPTTPGSAIFISETGGAISAGTHNLSVALNTITVAAAEALGDSDQTFVFVAHTGAGTIDLTGGGTDGFTLKAGQSLNGFDDGNSIAFGTTKPANISGDFGVLGGNVTQNSVTASNSNGAATSIVTTAGGSTIQNTVFDASGLGAGDAVIRVDGIAAANTVTINNVEISNVGTGATAVVLNNNASGVALTDVDLFGTNAGTALEIDAGTASTAAITVDAASSLSGTTGTVVSIGAGARDVTISTAISTTGSVGKVIDIDGQTGGTIGFAAITSATSTADNVIETTAQTGGALTFGDVSITGFGNNAADTAIELAGTGGSVSFADLDITTTNGGGFFASGAGLSVAATSGDFNIAGAEALSMNGVTANNFQLTSITANGAGTAAEALKFDNLGSSSTFTVTGATTLDNYTGAGIEVSSQSEDDATFNFAATNINTTAGQVSSTGDGVSLLTIGGANFDFNMGALTIGNATENMDEGFNVTNITGAGSAVDIASLTATRQSYAFYVTNFDVAGASITVAGTTDITNARTGAVSILNSDGNVTFGGQTTITNNVGFDGQGVDLGLGAGGANTGTYSFAGLDVTVNGAGVYGLRAQTTGTLNIAGATNDIISNNGTAILINPTVTNITLQNVTSSNSGTNGVDLELATGSTFTVTGITTITSSTGTGLVIDDSNATFTFGNVVIDNTATAGGGVAITGGAGNTATVNFNAGLNVDTASGVGFSAVGTGGALTLNIANAGTETINTTTGRIVMLDDLLIGAAGVHFDTLAASGRVANEGVLLSNVDGSGNTFSAGTVNVFDTDLVGFRIDDNSAATFNIGSLTVDGSDQIGLDITGTHGTITFGDVDIDGSGTMGVNIAAGANTVNINGGTIGATASPTTFGVRINGGSGTVNIAATVSKTTAGSNLIEVTGRTGGAVTFSGALSATGSSTGISVNNSTGGTINFNGATTLNTATNDAITLNGNNGAGITFSNVDIDTTTGNGIDASGVNTDINVSGTVDVATSGNRAFEFTTTSGDYDYSGVTSTQSGISAQAFGATHIGTYSLGTHTVTTPGLNALTIASTTLDLTYASFTVDGTSPSEAAIQIDNVSGSLTINGGTIRSAGGGALGRGIDLQNDDGVLNNFTLTTANTQFDVTNDAIFAETTTAGSTLNINVSGITAASNIGAQAVEIEWDDGGGTAVITNNVFDDGSSTAGLIEIDQGGNGLTSVTLSNNTMSNPGGEGIDIRTFEDAQMRVLISGNTVTSSANEAIRLEAEGTSNLQATVTNNSVVSVTNGSGIYIEVSAATATACLNATFNNNGAGGPPAAGTGGQSIELNNSGAGTLNISQADPTAVGVANNGATVLSTGGITGNQSCAVP
ncbi:inverse autotransporter beta domain-containing protein [Hoeflea ulvae]|uniref:Inverse autotransporter beta domain-containing protein n=1 Tax=Hoeflea ulvae TaxID=2983764 RepID=A0ABT3YCM8_9HYPH|nr:inverse autotransporter beta domain-containing protein [Hoeflea ulvae]MCY0093639.1 inverse autotransporter beta domain-containing protein [Hoeflea ulvae]